MMCVFVVYVYVCVYMYVHWSEAGCDEVERRVTTNRIGLSREIPLLPTHS